MIIVCEFVRWGLEHVPFNAGLIAALNAAYPDEEIAFLGEASHVDALKSTLPGLQAAVNFVAVDIPARNARSDSRARKDWQLVRSTLNRYRQENQSNLYLFCSPTSAILWALRASLRKLRQNDCVQVVFHGELAFVARWQGRNPYFRAMSLRCAIQGGYHERVQYLVLEETIRTRLLELFPKLHSCIRVLEHPISPGETTRKPLSLTRPLEVGFLGLATPEKGLIKYLELAEASCDKLGDAVRFHLIGRLHVNYRHLAKRLTNVLASPLPGDRLDRLDYIRRLESLHFVCLMFGPSYDLTASGVLLDCAGHGVPILGTPSPLLSDLTVRYGPLGYLEPDAIGGLVKRLADILEHSASSSYDEFVANLGRIRQDRSVAATGERLRKLRNEQLAGN